MGKLINRILFATDFSDCAVQAQRSAVSLARQCDAAVDVIHVVEFQPGMDVDYPINSRYLEYQRNEAATGLENVVQEFAKNESKAHSHLAVGLPSEQIAKLAKELDVDLVVVGTRGKTGLAHILLGSTAERVIARAPCPVLAVKELGPQGPRLHRIVIAVDLSDCSLDALEYGIQLGQELGQDVTLLHVLEPVSYGLDFTLIGHAEGLKLRQAWESRLADLQRLIDRQGLNSRHELRGGLPVDSILDYARQQRADLIVMGTHGRRGIAHLAAGSVTEAVLRRAPCPVLAVKSPKFAPGHRRVVTATVKAP